MKETETEPKTAARALRERIPDTTLSRGAISSTLAPVIAGLGLERNCRELAERGYTVIEDVADPELTARMRAFHLEHGAKQMLLRLDAMFCEAVLNPKLLAMVEYSVGQGALISQVTASVRGQGAPALALHADQNWIPAPFPEHNYLITFCWVHDQFTEENGATKVIPQTHLLRRHPRRDEVTAEKGAIAINAPANSVAVWDGSVWHGNYRRQTAGERVGTHITYSRLAMRPVEDYAADADALIAAHGDTMARLLGRSDFLQSPNGADHAKLPATFAMART